MKKATAAETLNTIVDTVKRAVSGGSYGNLTVDPTSIQATSELYNVYAKLIQICLSCFVEIFIGLFYVINAIFIATPLCGDIMKYIHSLNSGIGCNYNICFPVMSILPCTYFVCFKLHETCCVNVRMGYYRPVQLLREIHHYEPPVQLRACRRPVCNVRGHVC